MKKYKTRYSFISKEICNKSPPQKKKKNKCMNNNIHSGYSIYKQN